MIQSRPHNKIDNPPSLPYNFPINSFDTRNNSLRQRVSQFRMKNYVNDSRPSRQTAQIRADNRRRLLLTLLHHQPISRVRLARLTGISTPTVTQLVAPLIEEGVVAEMGTDRAGLTAGAGRKPTALQLVADSRYAIGIHIGARRAQICLGTLDARLLELRMVSHRLGDTPEVAIERMADAALALLAEAGLSAGDERVIGVGVGASGLVESESGVNIWAPGLEWRNVPLRELLSQRMGLPVAVENNVRCMALAEAIFGTGQGKPVLAFVYARIGVGAGLVVESRIYRGASHAAGEIGHWTMLPTGGERCRCGNTGCLETLISERVIVADAQRLDAGLLDAGLLDGATDPMETIFAAARNGHAPIRAMLEDRAVYAGIALANLVNALNPDLIVLGGLLDRGYDIFGPVLKEVVVKRSFNGAGTADILHPATFGEQSGPVGALSLALDTFFYSQATRRALPAFIGM